ncbi:hypothetical protein FW754_12975 [Acinetobacter sp. 1207_04]|uniref:hypothetical protein n=1 Tax=Acinetobacter sp. 1207_04 TaxID=2604449 RepID=UPI00405913B2
MKNFEVEITLSEGNGAEQTESFESQDINLILRKFFNINWRRQLLKQLQQMESESTFSVMNVETEQYISITLNAHSTQTEPQFHIDSNIEFSVVSKELLGLLKRTKNYTVIYKNLNQSQVVEQLSVFLDGHVDSMIEHYKQLLHKKSLQEYRIA